jgi:hypothetical protein
MEEIRVGDYVWIDGLRDVVVGLDEDYGTRLSAGRWICASKLRHLGGRTWAYDPENARDAEALALCRRGLCDAAYKQNREGGHARGVVEEAAKALGLNLHEDKVERNVWGLANMQRLVYQARGAMMAVEAQKRYIAILEAEIDRLTAPKSLRVLHEALTMRDVLQTSVSTRGL